MATSSIWVNPTQISAGPGIEVDSTGQNSARVSAKISTDPASILQFNPDGSLAAYEGGTANVVRVVPNNHDLTVYAGQYVIYREALYSFVAPDPLFPTTGEYEQRSAKQVETVPILFVGDTIVVDNAIYEWDGVAYKQRTLKQYEFSELPTSDVGPIYVPTVGNMEWDSGSSTYVQYPKASTGLFGMVLASTLPQVIAGTGNGYVSAAQLRNGVDVFSGGMDFPSWLGGFKLRWGVGNYTFNDNAVSFAKPFTSVVGVVATLIVAKNPNVTLVCSDIANSSFVIRGRLQDNSNAVPGWVNWFAYGT